MRRTGAVRAAAALALVGVGLAACTIERREPRPAARATTAGALVVPLRFPSDSEIPEGPLGAAIRRGRAILLATRDSLPEYVGSKLRCTSCHLDGGLRANASPFVGIYGQFPQYRSRAGHLISLEDRINGCFERSMNGKALPPDSRAMRDMLAYFAFLSRYVPVGAVVEGTGYPAVPPLQPDTAAGRALYAAECARCHGADGAGTPIAPPVWGDSSYNIGAGMARLRMAAAFIRHSMPLDLPGKLTDQQAYDVAAFINAQPRPDFPGKENDWPFGDPPPDVAYPTRAAAAKAALDRRTP